MSRRTLHQAANFMKHALQLLACLVLGVCIGWYFGHTRPEIVNQRKLLNEYQSLRDEVNLTDPSLDEILQELPKDFVGQIYQAQKKEDQMLASIGLAALKSLESGDVDAAKKLMARHVGGYYRLYRKNGGDADLLVKIEKESKHSTAISEELSRND